MILQALTSHYEDLVARSAIAPPGWSEVKVSFALYLDDSGRLTHVASTKTEQTKGKKTVLAPQLMKVPAPVTRTVGICSNFLCDHSGYLLGADNKGNPKRTAECFKACQALHEQLLCDVDSPAARAVLAFFRSWQPESAPSHPALAENWDEIISGGNLVFRYNGQYVHEDPAIGQAWQTHYLSAGDGPEMVCLVTGRKTSVEATHPLIKGIAGAQSSGAALVSFNAPAFCSYGKEQNYNAPTSQYAAFAYTAALNHLIADREHTAKIGDTTVLFWGKGGQPAYQGMFGGAVFGAPTTYSEEELWQKVKTLSEGTPVEFDHEKLDPQKPFYILGIAPNAARLSVRFFLCNSFGNILRNVREHQERLEIVRSSKDPFPTIPVWKLLSETVNPNSRDKTPTADMAGEVFRAIINNTRYPATLLNGVVLRIRAEHEVTRGRAAILKAYYLKNPNKDVPKEEVLTVSLNPDSTNVPYNLGRLFSVLEAVQSTANPGINSTIRDKYFNSAAATPSVIFPILISLAQKHLKKIRSSNPGMAAYYDRQMTELSNAIGTFFPTRLNLPQQGSFQLGYYHQNAARYQKKEEK